MNGLNTKLLVNVIKINIELPPGSFKIISQCFGKGLGHFRELMSLETVYNKVTKMFGQNYANSKNCFRIPVFTLSLYIYT